MINWLRFLVCCSISFSGMSQQQDTIRWSADATTTHSWIDTTVGRESFLFIAGIDWDMQRKNYYKTTHSHLVTTAKWLHSESFMNDSLASRYKPLAQLYFDCYELGSRKLQQLINLPSIDVSAEYIQSYQWVSDQIERINEETQFGLNQVAMTRNRQQMDSLLAANPRMFIPNYVAGKIGLVADLGTGVTAINGDLATYFKTLPAFGYGVGLRVKRCAFDYRALHSFSQAKQAFSVADFKFTDTNQLQINQSTWSFGYQLMNQERWSIIPYIGLSTFRVINRDEPKGSLFEKGRASYNFEAGCMAEWRFQQFYQSNTAQIFWKLLFKAGYAPVDYLDKVKGNALKFQIGIGFSVKSIVNVPFD